MVVVVLRRDKFLHADSGLEPLSCACSEAQHHHRVDMYIIFFLKAMLCNALLSLYASPLYCIVMGLRHGAGQDEDLHKI